MGITQHSLPSEYLEALEVAEISSANAKKLPAVADLERVEYRYQQLKQLFFSLANWTGDLPCAIRISGQIGLFFDVKD